MKSFMSKRTPVLMIGLDGGEATLIERLCSEGKLPKLKSLKEQGCFGILEANATTFSGGVWPTFYTSSAVPWHGIYHNKLWRAEHMRCEVVNRSWLPARPFWEVLDKEKYRIVIIDVPMTLGAPKPLDGVHLSGWATHDLLTKGSWPPYLWKQVSKKFGRPVIAPEFFGPQSSSTLLRLRDNLNEGTEQIVRISELLAEQEPWDLFLVVLGATHRGGHYLWNISQIDKDGLQPDVIHDLENALVNIYQACDQGIARLIEKAPNAANVLIFAVHGMGLNPGWSDRCPAILTKIQQKGKDVPAKSGILYQVRKVLPWRVIRQVTQRLPQKFLNSLVPLWSANMFDWNTTRYFPLPMDQAGYLRINLKGREPKGIVEPGYEYDLIIRELKEAFLSFRDIKSGEPIVREVFCLDDIAPKDALYREVLPDLVVTWGDVSAIHCDGIRSDRYGELRWKTAGKLPSGRSGNHKDKGWFLAVGDDIRPGFCTERFHIVDLVPTVFRWLGARSAKTFQGKPIPLLCVSE
jgi:predicted AlkP superfamily phosphohydrolase/phosphomutase